MGVNTGVIPASPLDQTKAEQAVQTFNGRATAAASDGLYATAQSSAAPHISPLPSAEEAVAIALAVAYLSESQAVGVGPTVEKTAPQEQPPLPPLPLLIYTGTQLYTPETDEGAAIFAALSTYLAEEETQPDQSVAVKPVKPDRKPAAEVKEATKPIAPLLIYTGTQLYTPESDEGVAVFAALSAYLAEEELLRDQGLGDQYYSGWQASRVMMTQYEGPMRVARRPAWSNIERLRRSRVGVSGVVGI